MIAGIAATQGPLVSYHAARLWAILATAILAVIAGGFLIPWFNRRRAKRISKKLKINVQQGSGSMPVAQQPDTAKTARLAAAKQRADNGAFALFLGKDGRLSTSTTIAWAWTVVISWVLLALIIAWPPDWGKAFTHFDGTYFALLGGPYAAWVLARVAVTARVSNSTLQKPVGDGVPRLSDLVSADNGNPDLFDAQYVMFNLIAMVFVVLAFSHTSQDGFPLIPPVLVLLTGGPAAVYSANKVLATNGPTIFSVSPSIVTANNSFTVFGQNFLAGAAPSSNSGKLRVLVGGWEATVDTDSATDGAVSAVAPETDYSDAAPLAVTLITPAGAQAWLQGAVTVRTAPTLIGTDRATAKAADVVTLTGEWYDPQNAPLTILLDGTSATVPQPNDKLTSNTAQFMVPQPQTNGVATTVNIHVRQYDQQSANTVPLTLEP
jgi:hypothetical protein